MKVIVAKTAGFCFGVSRAVESVYNELSLGKKNIYTYGPIIHNEQVVDDLKKKGVKIIEDDRDFDIPEGSTVVIRSHGITKDVQKRLEEKNIDIVDATCPFVKKIHNIVSEKSREGKVIIIFGDPNHPEVKGIVGWCDGEVYVTRDREDFFKLDLSLNREICIVAQTTFNYDKFQDLVANIRKKGYDMIVLNTICNATKERQEEARKIASEVDGMIVVGGKHSSNTQKLYEICCKECKNICHIQVAGDLDPTWLHSLQSVGITAGASTPNNIIEEVQTYVRNEF